MRKYRDIKRTHTAAVFLAALMLYAAGCNDTFFSPSSIGRFRPVPAVNVILDSLGVADETPPAWETGEEPTPADVIAYETDYVLDVGDSIRVSIFELLQAGVPFINEYVISETGRITITEVGTIDVAGLTESQFEEELKQILSPGILKEPSVTVILVSSVKRAYSIQGNGIPRPSRYGIPRYEYRLLDALAQAGGVGQFNTSYVYVLRKVTGLEQMTNQQQKISTQKNELQTERKDNQTYIQTTKPQELEKFTNPENEMMDIIAPYALGKSNENKIIITSAEMVTDRELKEAALPQGWDNTVKNSNAENEINELAPKNVGQSGIEKNIKNKNEARVEWVFKNGKWVPLKVGYQQQQGTKEEFKIPKTVEPLKEKEFTEFEWQQTEAGTTQNRVMKIPVDKLLGGDFRYNIIIKPGDNIHVPLDIMGEFYIMGNTNSQGFINLTGRPMTLKMAIAAAGGLGTLAWPKRCEVTRRISRNKEETVMVDLDKIAKGEQPDFFIKPNDLINVGTHPTSMWRAVLRNAFRATYGFGFIYDRNFADRDFGTSRPIPNFLTQF